MSTKVIKDKQTRQYIFFEKQLFLNQLFVQVPTATEKQLLLFSKKQSLVILKNHCIYTQRSRSVFKFFRCSRIILRQLGLGSLFCGFKKQSRLFLALMMERETW
jgi:ribosomal protein S14